MSVYDNYVGQKFGRLTVIKRLEDKIENGKWVIRRPQFLCQCECGNTRIVLGRFLKSGDVKSCGCLKRDKTIERNKAGQKHNIYDMSNEYGIGWNEDKTFSFKFDKEDYDKIKDIYWNNHKGYAIGGNNESTHWAMHRIIMNIDDPKIEVDHINHDTSDNRKCNLRLTTHAENLRNTKLYKNSTTGITGITVLKNGRYNAHISYNGKTKNLGNYIDLEDAIQARKDAEEKYFGEYSYAASQELVSQLD